MRHAPEEILHQAANFRNARRSSDEHDLVDLFGLQPCVFECLLAGADGAVDDGLDHLLERLERNFAAILFPIGQFDVELCGGLRRKSDLRFDDRFADSGYGFAIVACVLAQVESEIAANVVDCDGDQQIVDVVSAEVRVAVGGDYFENSVVQLENRNVERAAAQIVDCDDAVFLFVQAVGQRGSGRLVDQTQDIQAGDAAGVFRCLALRVVEVCGDGDDGLGYRRSEEALGIALQLAQDECRNFWRSVGSIANLDAENFALVKIVG